MSIGQPRDRQGLANPIWKQINNQQLSRDLDGNDSEAKVEQWQKQAEKVPIAAPERPMLFSSDSRLFAYCPIGSGRSAVAVWDLNALKPIALFNLPIAPSQLAWAPDMSRILYAGEGRIGILNLANSAVVELPRPKNQGVPQGRIDWWLDDHVEFFPSDEPALDFDLTDLEFRKLDRNADSLVSQTKITSATNSTQATTPRNPTVDFPRNTDWEMTLDACIRGIQPPARKNPSGPWNIVGFPTLAIKATDTENLR